MRNECQRSGAPSATAGPRNDSASASRGDMVADSNDDEVEIDDDEVEIDDDDDEPPPPPPPPTEGTKMATSRAVSATTPATPSSLPVPTAIR